MRIPGTSRSAGGGGAKKPQGGMPTGVRSPYSSVAESFVRFRGLPMSYTYYIYKTQEKVKSKYTMRICSLREHRLKHEWNQMVWSVNNLRCGTAVQPKLPFPHLCTAAPLTPCSLAGCLAANRRSTRPSSYLDIRRPRSTLYSFVISNYPALLSARSA